MSHPQLKTEHPFYSFRKVCSYNAVFNFIVGGRGLGKTYGAKVDAVKKFIKKGEQFIYLRRNKGDLAGRHSFFVDFEHEFPEWDFRVRGVVAEGAPVSTRDEGKKRPWKLMGYFIALSQGQSFKSVPFTYVTTIIFDEFILEEGLVQYLPNEATVFLNFYNTVDRTQDRVTVYFLANSVSIINPHFLYYGIQPREGEEFIVKGGGFLVCHLPEAKDYAASVETTRFGQFIKDTDYAQYAVVNKFNDNHDALLDMKDGVAKYEYTIETKKGSFSVWYSGKSGLWYVQSKLPKNQTVYCMELNKMTDRKIFANFRDPLFGYLRRAFVRGKGRFDNATTRNIFIDIYKR